MITRDNYKEVISMIKPSDINRLRKNKTAAYCVLMLHVFNAGAVVSITLTNNYDKYENVSDSGNAIVETDELLKDLDNVYNEVYLIDGYTIRFNGFKQVWQVLKSEQDYVYFEADTLPEAKSYTN